MTDDTSAMIGAAVRRHRTNAGLSARELAGRCGVSQPFLSQVERGLSAPSIATLYNIAEALKVSPAELLPPRPGSGIRLVRSDDRQLHRVTESPNTTVARLASGGGQVGELYEYRISPDEDVAGWYRRDEDLALLLLEGVLRVELEGIGSFELTPGDCLFHPGSVRHRWTRPGSGPVHLVLCVGASASAAGAQR